MLRTFERMPRKPPRSHPAAFGLRGLRVHEFIVSVTSGEPLVKQMLMGGGKTTVVGPLLALMLADGERLVVQTMPPALVRQQGANSHVPRVIFG